VISKADLTRLALDDKRQVARALVQRVLAEPRALPLSYSQEQLWFMDKLQPGSPLYNIPLYVPVQGRLDLAALKKALATLTGRHDMLRVHFATRNDAPVQIVEPHVAVELPIDDLSALRPDERNVALGQRLNAEVQTPFDLSAGVCVRYRLFRLDALNHLLSVTMHHIVTDAWSLGVFVSELNRTYDAYRRGERQPPLPPLFVEYSDYAQWQRANLRGLRLTKLVNYWTTQLAGAPPVLRLPTDRPRPQDQSFTGTVAGFMFDDELSEALLAASRQQRVTLFMLLLACYYTLLYRYTGQEDIIVGAPVANRAHPELEPVIGIFVNTLILRARVHDGETFAGLVKQVQAMAVSAFEHQALPFEKLIETLNIERLPGYPPLYQVVFNFQNATLIESSSPSAEGEAMAKGAFPFVHSNTAKVDLNLTVTQNGATISGGIEYSTDLFDAATIDTMIRHYRTIAETIVRDPDIALMDIALTADGAHTAADEAAELEARSGAFIDAGRFSFEEEL